MRMLRVVFVLAVLSGAIVLLFGAWAIDQPVATFSILGFDPQTGELGGAVQSRVFSPIQELRRLVEKASQQRAQLEQFQRRFQSRQDRQ